MKCVQEDHKSSSGAPRFGASSAMAILIAFAGTVIPAQAAFTSITTCNTAVAAPGGSLINAPGDYAVNAELISAAGDCILITARGVSLKLNGHSITGPSAAGIGINVNSPSGRVDHVGIQGPGRITGFTNGITMTNTDYSQVSQVTSAHNLSNGISGAGNTFLTVGSNVLVGNGIWGLLLQNLTNSTIFYNEMSGNGGSPAVAGGLRITGSANTVNNNIASGNGTQVGAASFNAGLVIASTSTRVYGNVTDGNVGPGIQVVGTSNQIFSNTSSVGNGTFDLQDDNAACDSNLWSNNSSFTRNLSCVK